MPKFEMPTEQVPVQSQEKPSSIVEVNLTELKKKFEEQTGEECPFSDEELTRLAPHLGIIVLPEEQLQQMDEAERKRKQLFAEFWRKEGASTKDLKWGWKSDPNTPRVPVGRFTDKGVEITPQASEEIRKSLDQTTGKTYAEQKRIILSQQGQEILHQAKEAGSWVKDWTPQEDAKFVEGYINTMEVMEEAAREMPENTPPARVNIGHWGTMPRLDFDWSQSMDSDKDLEPTMPKREIKI